MAVTECPAADEPTASATLLVDGHVHFHECFTWKTFLDCAAANFARARRMLGLTPASPGCLMFTESDGRNHYRMLLDHPAFVRSTGWRLDKSDDDCSIRVTRPGGDWMLVIAGRQIVTAEHLEVLALGSLHQPPDGRPIGDIVRWVADHDAIAVIPWGFGKWLGRRGRILRDLIDRTEVPFCLGDNGGRAHRLRRPSLFERAELRSVPVLGGSDPLPFPGQSKRVGSYGFVLDNWRPTARPAGAIRTRIQALTQSPPAFGELSSVAAMVRMQLALRWRRRSGTSLRTRTGSAATPAGRPTSTTL